MDEVYRSCAENVIDEGGFDGSLASCGAAVIVVLKSLTSCERYTAGRVCGALEKAGEGCGVAGDGDTVGDQAVRVKDRNACIKSVSCAISVNVYDEIGSRSGSGHCCVCGGLVGSKIAVNTVNEVLVGLIARINGGVRVVDNVL